MSKQLGEKDVAQVWHQQQQGMGRYQGMVFYLLALCFLTLSCSAWGVSPTANPSYVFTGVNVVQLKDGRVSENQFLQVEGQRIVAMGAMDNAAQWPESAQIVDANGWFVMPGLYEMHAHIPPEQAGAQKTQDTLRLYLANGITTTRGMLGEPGHLRLRESLASGEVLGPRLITSGPSFNGRSVESTKGAEAMVQAQAEAGYDFLKLHPGLGPLEYDALVRAARKHNIAFAGHVSTDVGIPRTLKAGQATIDHLDGYAQELVPPESPLRMRDPGFFGIAIASAMTADRITALARATAKARVWNVPTQSLMENILGSRTVESMLQRPEMVYVDASTKAQWKRSVESLRSEYAEADRLHFLQLRRILIAALQEADAGLLLGSDAPQIMNVPGFSIHEELALMVRAGLNEQQALQMGTMNPAQFLAEQHQHGMIRPGYVADLVFLSKNPLADIDNTRSIQGVFHQGQWHNRATLDAWLDEVQSHQQ
jgi:imidazolonepropionase-like amidohydrolase